MKSKTIVFIHGMYMNPLCWEQWINFYQAKGYQCLAPAWPGRDKPVDTLRKQHPDPQLGNLTLSDVQTHFTDVIKPLAEKPILIGHSMGGLLVQILLQQDSAAAGVAIGAIAGDAGKGAAIGAAAGAMAGRQKGKQAQAQQNKAAQDNAAKSEQAMIESYNKAFSVCIEGKGYTVK